ncbi:hypothetical protein ACWELB_14670 [Streptomyces asiaticus]|uniref:hypothetical protein n=1 Tax=Streptomyces asiaticus TaxID=114695 RepID=UPI001A2AEC24|nr:hypothetical protein [Streptomyces albiflaviniger]
MPPKYDFAAADRLSQQLFQLIGRLEAFIGLREGQRNALLGGRHSENWQGARRDRFQSDFGSQQQALTALKEAALRLQSQVANATTAAHAAEKAEKNKQ